MNKRIDNLENKIDDFERLLNNLTINTNNFTKTGTNLLNISNSFCSFNFISFSLSESKLLSLSNLTFFSFLNLSIDKSIFSSFISIFFIVIIKL